MPRTTTTPVGPRGAPTPGPWTATETSLALDFVYGIKTADGERLPMTGPEGHANARLMALAPQMLTALRGIVRDVQSREGWQDEIGTLISWDWWARAVDVVDRMAPADRENS